MATSGTYTQSMALGDLVLNAFSRVKVRPSMLTPEHLETARMEANLMLAEWSNRGPNLWAIDLEDITLVAGTATYTLPAETVCLFEVYIQNASQGAANRRLLTSVSRSEYASYPDVTTQGQPITYWFDRRVTPQITFWPPPDNSTTWTVKYYRMRQVQDAALTNATDMEVPYRWLDAVAAGLAGRLAKHFAPDLEVKREADAERAFQIASVEDVEAVPMYIMPGLSGYRA